jgi:hypothetical protein
VVSLQMCNYITHTPRLTQCRRVGEHNRLQRYDDIPSKVEVFTQQLSTITIQVCSRASSPGMAPTQITNCSALATALVSFLPVAGSTARTSLLARSMHWVISSCVGQTSREREKIKTFQVVLIYMQI